LLGRHDSLALFRNQFLSYNLMKKIYFIIFSLIAQISFSQGEDATTATVFTPALSCSLTATTCTGPSYNLGSTTSVQTPSNGTMANDVWFSFVAPSTVVKVRVCPSAFDAAVEIRSSDGNSLITSYNNTGSGGKEVSCITGLTYGSTYTVRVGRVSGSGAGTFQMNIEHHASAVRNGYYPGPAGEACYLSGHGIQRSLPCPGVFYAQTRFFFQGIGVPNIGPFTTTGGNPNMGSISSAWVSGASYSCTIEVQANDTECGLIWWGYSIPRTITFCSVCDIPWSGTSINPNNTTLSTMCTNFSVTPSYGNYQFKYKFQTNNGNVEFCSNWATGDLALCSSNILPCLRYGKSYQVSFAARLDPTDPLCWFGPTTISTPPIPYVNISTTECCKWRNPNGGFIQGTSLYGFTQYRFRLTPINPCNVSTPLAAIGPAVTTGWTTAAVINPSTLVTPGTIYLVQQQARSANVTCANCSGVNNTIAGQQTDWGSLCVIGMRSSSSPAVGTPIGCFCTPSLTTQFVEEDLTYVSEYRSANKTDVSTIEQTGQKILTVDLEATGTMGNGVIQLRTLTGQLVKEHSVISSDQQVEIDLNMSSNFTSGIYLITILTEGGIHSEKIYLTN
jgi:hypothetical protein